MREAINVELLKRKSATTAEPATAITPQQLTERMELAKSVAELSGVMDTAILTAMSDQDRWALNQVAKQHMSRLRLTKKGCCDEADGEEWGDGMSVNHYGSVNKKVSPLMPEYIMLITALTVLPRKESIFSEMATTIRLEDEGAGLFVTVSQEGRDKPGKVTLCAEEWPAIRAAIDQQMQRCASHEMPESGEHTGG